MKHEIDTLQQDVDSAKAKLSEESKLRQRTDSELRAIRAETMRRQLETNAINSDLNSDAVSNTPFFLNPPAKVSNESDAPFRLNMPPAEATGASAALLATQFEQIPETERENDATNRSAFNSPSLQKLEEQLGGKFNHLDRLIAGNT